MDAQLRSGRSRARRTYPPHRRRGPVGGALGRAISVRDRLGKPGMSQLFLEISALSFSRKTQGDAFAVKSVADEPAGRAYFTDKDRQV
jgi:hypothetical protein